MQLFLIVIALFSFFTLPSTVFSLALQYTRQASLNLPLSLCALKLESKNDHIIDALCVGPFEGAEIRIINSKLSLDKCLINSFGQLKFFGLGGFSTTCNECRLDNETLDFSCTCDNGSRDSSSVISNINLALTTPGGTGVFLQDDGNIACQAPDT